MDDLTAGKQYSFSTLYPSVLLKSYKNMRLEVEAMTFDLAVKFDDVMVKHSNIQATAMVDDPIKSLDAKSLNWVLFKDTETNVHLVLAKEYLDTTTIQETGDSLRFEVANTGPNDKAIIVTELKKLGFNITLLD